MVAWMAIEKALGSMWGTRRFEVSLTPDQVTESGYTINFSRATGLSAPPLFLADMQSHDNVRSSHLRYTSLDKSKAQVGQSLIHPPLDTKFLRIPR